jgi:hypothetical protein
VNGRPGGDRIGIAMALLWLVAALLVNEWYMDRLARAHGAQFVMAPIVLDDHRHRQILESFARSHGIAFVDTRELSRDLAGPNFLPHDGHFSPAGAETMAQLVARHLEGAAGRVR